MKFRMRFLFAFVAIFVTLAFVSCNGTGKTGNTPGQSGDDQDHNNPNVSKDKVVLKFDAKKIVVIDLGGGYPLNGSEVKIGTRLVFDTIPGAIDANKIFDGFRINENKKKIGKEEPYVVDANDAVMENNKKVINITFVEREKSKDKIKVIFGEKIKATAILNGASTNIQSEQLLEEGTNIDFVATVSDGKILDNWFFNGEKKVGLIQDKSLSYTLNINDARDKNGIKEIEVTFTEKDVKTITIQYDEDKIGELRASDPQGGQAIALEQNAEVNTGTKIYFSLKDEIIKQGKIVDHFTINGKKNDAVNIDVLGYGHYVIDDKDAEKQGEKLIIKVSAVVRGATSAKLQFDEKEIQILDCTEGHQNAVEKKNGDEVQEKRILLMTLKDDNKMSERWLCNGTLLPVDPRDENSAVLYVSASHMKKVGSGYVLHITVETRERAKIKIKFDSPITCNFRGNGPYQAGETITSGSTVKEGEAIIFRAEVPDGKIFEHWLLGDKERKSSTHENNVQVLFYEVDKNDAKNGELEVKFVVRDKLKAKLVFEEEMIKVERKYQQLHNGDIVTEGDSLEFNIKDGKDENKVVKKWLINDSEFQKEDSAGYSRDDNRGISLRLKSKHIKTVGGENVLKVRYETREAKQIKIEFDSNKIECTTKNGTSITNGAKVAESNWIEFRAKDGVYVAKWKLNNKHIESHDNRVWYGVMVMEKNAAGAENDLVISVSIEERQAFDIAIEFDPEKIECKNGVETVATGTKIKENTRLTFKAKNVQGQSSISWFIGDGNSMSGMDATEPIDITARLDYAGLKEGTSDYVIRVRWE